LLKDSQNKVFNQIIDANINRLKEGLRVCEEIARFILKNRALTKEFKKIRHKIDILSKKLISPAVLVKSRCILSDVGRDIHILELERKSYQDILYANLQRAKESLRVLEEFSKLTNKNIALKFKKLRYTLYEMEKRIIKKIGTLCNHR